MQVGIDSISFYTSKYYLDLKTLAMARGVDPNKYYEGLGQHKMAVMPADEDVVTLAAEACKRALRNTDLNDIEMLLFATETGIDQSKSAGVFVHNLLQLPTRCRVIELKQACYSATCALQLALPWLKQNPTKKVLLVASDIAKYGINTTGESSQGGGAVAMVLSADPKIVAFEEFSGIYTEDAMDFWRPNYREEALVDGRYSCDLYLKMLEKTFVQYCELTNRTLADIDKICYHSPVPKLVEKAHKKIYKCAKQTISKEQIDFDLKDSLHYARLVGNCYTAALYLGLMSLLENSNEDLTNKRIGFYSYGSGSVAEFFTAIVQNGYKKALDKDYNKELLDSRVELDINQYEACYGFKYPQDGSDLVIPNEKDGSYRLAKILEHKRIYEAS